MNDYGCLGCVEMEEDLSSVTVNHMTNEQWLYSNIEQTIYLSEPGVPTRLQGKVGHGGDTQDMAVISIRVKTDSLNNRKVAVQYHLYVYFIVAYLTIINDIVFCFF